MSMCIQILRIFNKVSLKNPDYIIETKKKGAEGLVHAIEGMGQCWSLQLPSSALLIYALCIACVLFYQVILKLAITYIFKKTLEINAILNFFIII